MDLKILPDADYILKGNLTKLFGSQRINESVRKGKLHGILIIAGSKLRCCLFPREEVESLARELNKETDPNLETLTGFRKGHDILLRYKSVTIMSYSPDTPKKSNLRPRNKDDTPASIYFRARFGLHEMRDDDFFERLAWFHRAYRIHPKPLKGGYMVYTEEQKRDLDLISEEGLSPTKYQEIVDSRTEPTEDPTLEDELEDDF